MLRVSRQRIAWCLQGSPAKKNFCSAMSEYNTACQKGEESRGLSMHTQDIQPIAVHKFVIWSYRSRSSTTPTLCKNYVMEGRGLSCLPRRSVGVLVVGVWPLRYVTGYARKVLGYVPPTCFLAPAGVMHRDGSRPSTAVSGRRHDFLAAPYLG